MLVEDTNHIITCYIDTVRQGSNVLCVCVCVCVCVCGVCVCVCACLSTRERGRERTLFSMQERVKGGSILQ